MPGRELDYVQITANATNATTSYADVADLEITLNRVAPGRPILVRFRCANQLNTAANGGVAIAITENGTVIGTASTLEDAASNGSPATIEARSVVTGAAVYKVRLKALFSGTATISAGVSDPSPAYLQIIEI